MKYLNRDQSIMDADSAEDAAVPTALLESKVRELQERIISLPPGHKAIDKARLQLDIGPLLLNLERNEEAFDLAREAFDVYIENEMWEGAVIACEIMFNAEQPDSLAALGQGIWLGVTFPDVDPELTVVMLDHVIDETPADADGAALAATVASYIVDLRTEGKKHEDLSFFTNQRLAEVARRHSNIETQETFAKWVEKLELNEPEKFLVRLRNVVDVLVQDDWWIEREAIWAKLPVN